METEVKTMREVSKKEFYKFIYDNKLDVHPYIVSDWDDEIGYKKVWKYRNGNIMGRSQGYRVKRYWLA